MEKYKQVVEFENYGYQNKKIGMEDFVFFMAGMCFFSLFYVSVTKSAIHLLIPLFLYLAIFLLCYVKKRKVYYVKIK